MVCVHELEVWSRPGLQLPVDFGKKLAEEIHLIGISTTIFLGLSFVPDATDVQNLRFSFEDGELNSQLFENYCSLQGLPPDSSSAYVAARFLEYSFGRKLAWLHLPEDQEAELLPRIQFALKERGLVVVDPESIACLLGPW